VCAEHDNMHAQKMICSEAKPEQIIKDYNVKVLMDKVISY
jgi:hypothetical protein